MANDHLTADKLCKSYGSAVALTDVDLSVKQGEFFVLLGPSGCGKSTLLRMVAGLETISSGDLHIDGNVVNEVHPKDRNIAMVFQNYALYPHMSVRQNLAYPMKVAGLKKRDQEREVANVAELLELGPYLDRKPAQLSGGQRQRVAMGRALVRKPALFLMDEPLSNLDARLRQQMRVEIKSLQMRLGITTLYVTHDQVEAMTMADRIMVLNDGKVQQVGTPAEIYHEPANLFVASFVGSPPTNFIQDVGFTTGLTQQRPALLALDEGCIAAIRPEEIQLSDACEVPHAVLQARCISSEALGSETLCHFDLELAPEGRAGTNPEDLRHAPAMVTAKWPGDHTHLNGAAVSLAIPYQKTMIYSQSTGQMVRQ